jgi:chemotaxis methyl-accepting protein methylase
MYLSEMHRLALLRRFYEYLEAGGYLFAGSKEPVARLAGKFEVTLHGDCALYQKPIAPPKPSKVPHGVAGRNGKAEREKKA